MSVSVGVLYSSYKFLELLHRTVSTEEDIRNSFSKFYVASLNSVFEVCELCNWIRAESTGNLVVTERGYEVLSEKVSYNFLRIQLKHMIYLNKPSWSKVLHYGRLESFQYLPTDVKQCFEEAQLTDGYDLETVTWWDTVSAFIRNGIDEKKLSIGRLGERLSLQYEEDRVGETPTWKSIESNLAGYDLLSWIDSDKAEKLKVEVKTTTIDDKERLTFYLTKKEWEVASTSSNHVFHLWSLYNGEKLYVFLPALIEKQIPINQGKGSWEHVKIELARYELEKHRRSG